MLAFWAILYCKVHYRSSLESIQQFCSTIHKDNLHVSTCTHYTNSMIEYIEGSTIVLPILDGLRLYKKGYQKLIKFRFSLYMVSSIDVGGGKKKTKSFNISTF